MRWLAILSLATLTGCCCFPSGRHGPSSTSTDQGGMKQWIAEKATEKAVQAVTGEKLDIDASGKKVTVTTPDGKLTTWADHSLPEGFPYPLQPNATVSASMRLDPTDPTQVPMLSVFYEVPGPPADAVAYWTKVGKDAGYQVQSLASQSVDAMDQAREQGVTLPPTEVLGNNMGNAGDILVWKGGDDKEIGTVMIGTESSKTQVMISVPAPGAKPAAEAPAP